MSVGRFNTWKSLDDLTSINIGDVATKVYVDSLQTTASVANYNALSTVNTSKYTQARTQGYYTPGDGGGGLYKYVSGAWTLQHDGIVSVLQFGAVGDMATDCTAAFQAALAAVRGRLRAGTVKIPHGIFNVSSTLNLDTNYMTLVGEGRSASMIRCVTNGISIVNVTGQFVTVKGVEIAPSVQGTSGNVGIYVNGATFNAEDFVVSNAYDAVVFKVGSAHILRNFYINDSTNTGLFFNGTSGFVNDVFISDFFIGSADNTKFALGAIRVYGRLEAFMAQRGDMIGGAYSFTSDANGSIGFRYSTFDSVFFDSTSFGAQFNGGGYLSFNNCWFSNGRTKLAAGALFTGVSHFSISGTKAFNSGSYGVNITGCSDFSITGCDFSNNSADTSGYAGLNITGSSTRFSVVGCNGDYGSNAKQSYGCLVDNGCSNYSLSENKFGTHVSGSMLDFVSNVGRRVFSNLNYEMRKRGDTNFPASATSYTVAHGMQVVPTLQSARVYQHGASAAPIYVSAVDGTNLTIVTPTTNTGTTPITWEIDMSY